MKKFASIALIAAMMLSLTSVTIFAQDSSITQNSSINITFTAPRVGDGISGPLAISAESSSLSITKTSVLYIYDGATFDSLKEVNSADDLSAFSDTNLGWKYTSGSYAAKDYIVIFSVTATSVPSNTTFAFGTGITGGTLYLKPLNNDATMLYGYIKFTPSLILQSQSMDVRATYLAPEAPEPVYSVNISFDSMEFIYTAESKDNWNYTDHKYETITPASWSFDNNSITVTNHSNVPVTASFSYTATPEFSNVVNGSFTDDSREPLPSTQIGLSSADDTSGGAKKSTTVYLLLSGTLPSNTSAGTKCGTVTVTIQ